MNALGEIMRILLFCRNLLKMEQKNISGSQPGEASQDSCRGTDGTVVPPALGLGSLEQRPSSGGEERLRSAWANTGPWHSLSKASLTRARSCSLCCPPAACPVWCGRVQRADTHSFLSLLYLAN